MHFGHVSLCCGLVGQRHVSSPEKRIWLVTDAYAIVASLQAPIYFRFLALVS